MGTLGNEEAFCLKWNDFPTSLTSTFAELRNESDLFDATIICEGQALRAHKLVLSACSNVFRQLFRNSNVETLGLVGPMSKPQLEPVILMFDVKANDLKLLFNFMYEGQVNVAQDHLNTFLALAERLQVRGLTNTAGPAVMRTTNTTPNLRRVRMAPPASKRPRTAIAGSVAAAPGVGPVPEDLEQDESIGAPIIKHELKGDTADAYGNPAAAALVGGGGGLPVVANPFPGHVTQFNQFNYDSTTHGAAATVAAAGQTGNGTDTSNSSDYATPAAVGAHPGAAPGLNAEDFSLQPGANLIDGGQKGGVVVLGSSVSHAAASAVVPSSNTSAAAVAPPATTSSSNNSSNNTTSSTSKSSQNNSGTCPHCNKHFRQLRSHIQDVHCPTPTPCPLCGKMFSSKHKMFGHKYRSCPNRTRNLVRHLQDLDVPSSQQQAQGGAGGQPDGGAGGQPQTQAQPQQLQQQQQQQQPDLVPADQHQQQQQPHPQF